ncbi:MAG TPA: class I SAM-dependent methyltransferase [Gemmataceae bacterium]|nr:class I SAM-dependent methyltransferase [Gemmataceae bacterium]
MSAPPPRAKRPDYGIDAPGAVRNLAIGGAAALVLAAAAFPLGWAPLARMAIGCLFGAGWMVWGSKVEKVRERDRLLDSLPWRGDEAVLDVGCGRGLHLIGAAKRLTTGKAVGVDIWQAEDLSGNRPETTLEIARLEGVSDRVEVKDGNARRLPFGDCTFDVVVTKGVLHNIDNAAERDTAVREIARVLTPGGRLLIEDVRHTGRYAQVLRQSGLEDVRRSPQSVSSLLIAAITLGFAYPATVRARKPAAAA